MKQIAVLIFGFNKFALEIADNVKDKYENIYMYSFNLVDISSGEYSVKYFDLSDDWSDLDNHYDMEKSLAFCVLENDAENIFLTISLRANFSDLTILAIAKDKESVNKLRMAGANKVIPLVETTAEIIANMIEKPIVTKVLHEILYEQSDLKIAQIKVENESCFEGKYFFDIDWNQYRGIVMLSIIHEDNSGEFIYSSKAKHTLIQNGDIFVVVGYEVDINEFEKLIGRICNVNRDNWSR
jgi:Trk K+ transport system NAD-binding subunit